MLISDGSIVLWQRGKSRGFITLKSPQLLAISLDNLIKVKYFGEDLTCGTGCKPDPHFTLNSGAASSNDGCQLEFNLSVSDRCQKLNTSLSVQHNMKLARKMVAVQLKVYDG